MPHQATKLELIQALPVETGRIQEHSVSTRVAGPVRRAPGIDDFNKIRRAPEQPVVTPQHRSPVRAPAPRGVVRRARETAVGPGLARLLDFHGAPEEVREAIMSAALALRVDGSTRHGLQAVLAHCLSFSPFEDDLLRPLLLVGPPGSGKTITAARLARRLMRSGREAALITADGERPGGVASLAEAARKVGCAFLSSRGPADCADQLSLIDPRIVALIDGAPVNPYNVADVVGLKTLLRETGAEPVLVLSAGIEPREAAATARAFARLGVRRMVCSGLDLSRRIGASLGAAQSGRLAYAGFAANGDGDRGLTRPSAATLAAYLLEPIGRNGGQV